jgi:hypothetical protein
MSKIRIRPLTVLLLLVAIALLVLAFIYFTTSASSLPSFFPGHAPHSAKHHVKHGAALTTLAVLALVGAWFTTAPAETEDDAAGDHDVWGGPVSKS